MTGPAEQDDQPDLAAEAMAAMAARRPAPVRWRLIWSGAGILLVLALALAVRFITWAAPPTACREDEEWLYVWLLFSPTIAVVAVVAMSVVALAASSRGSFMALFVAPILSWVAGFLLASTLEQACVTSNVAYGIVTVILPAVIGIGTVLVPVLRREHGRA